MEHLWTPWRSTYVNETRDRAGCVFCHAGGSTRDEEALVVHRSGLNFVILNRYPYTNGHLMIAPYLHISRLQQMEDGAAEEMMRLARLAERIIEETYRPQGINIGMNLGAAAGAGIEQHIHLHVLPRWFADANFMTSVCDTRIIPEELAITFSKLSQAFRKAD
jgi:ATP adenylyltransferase